MTLFLLGALLSCSTWSSQTKYADLPRGNGLGESASADVASNPNLDGSSIRREESSVFTKNSNEAHIIKPVPSIKQDEDAGTEGNKESGQSELVTSVQESEGGLKLTVGVPTEGHHAEIIGLFPVVLAGTAMERSAISIDKAGLVLLWDLGTAASSKLLQVKEGIDQVAFCPEFNLLGTASLNQLNIYSLGTGERLHKLDRLGTRVTALEFHPQCQSLLVGGTDGMIYRWKFKEQKENISSKRKEDLWLERYIGHATVISAITFHAFGRFFLSGDWYGTLSAWLLLDRDVYGGEYNENLFVSGIFSKKQARVKAIRENRQPITRLITSLDGQNLFVALQDGSLEWWEIRGLKQQAKMQAHSGLIYDMALNVSGKLLATAGRDGKLKLWTYSRGQPEKNISGTLTAVQEFAIAGVRKIAFPKEESILAGDKDGKVLSVKVELASPPSDETYMPAPGMNPAPTVSPPA